MYRSVAQPRFRGIEMYGNFSVKVCMITTKASAFIDSCVRSFWSRCEVPFNRYNMGPSIWLVADAHSYSVISAKLFRKKQHAWLSERLRQEWVCRNILHYYMYYTLISMFLGRSVSVEWVKISILAPAFANINRNWHIDLRNISFDLLFWIFQ